MTGPANTEKMTAAAPISPNLIMRSSIQAGYRVYVKLPLVIPKKYLIQQPPLAMHNSLSGGQPGWRRVCPDIWINAHMLRQSAGCAPAVAESIEQAFMGRREHGCLHSSADKSNPQSLGEMTFEVSASFEAGHGHE
jgi:hypothetical protein